MFDYIKDHALKNVWCTPDQDNQLIIEPARLTQIDGALNNFKLMWRKITLPETKARWHIYQVGQLHPLVIGLFPNVGQWVSFAKTCNEQRMICDIYVNSGVQLPRVDTYYMYTKDNDLVIAIRENKNINFNFNEDAIFLRVYTNEYFRSLRSDATVDSIYIEGIRATTVEQILVLQNNYNTYSQKQGITYAFVNGYKVDAIDLINMKIGDVGEFVYDSSIIKVVDFKVGDLNTFVSTLDSKIKYLLHYAGPDNNTIDYQDDIDFFVLDPYAPNRHRGVFYHKNQADAARMLTHRDYSVTVPYVAGYTLPIQQACGYDRRIDPKNLIIRLHIRKSGFLRPIVYEHNRIKELYKMTDVDIINAMVGLNSVVENWRAEVLEASDYTKIMRCKFSEVTNEMVQYGYGYNAVSKIIGDTPSKTRVRSFRQIIDVPYSLQASCTAYEYDANGVLLEHNYHSFGSQYNSNNPKTRLVELISGQGTELIGDSFGYDNVPVFTNIDYRVYACKIIGSTPTYKWKDVTGTSAYVILNGKVKWMDDTYVPYIMVRNNNSFLSYDLDLPFSRGEIRFSLDQLETKEGVTNKWVMQVPMGELDIFLNGKSLIKNLDYFLHFPEIVIVNKEYLNDPLNVNQKIHVRFTGFCDNQLNLTPVNEAGFIEYNLLSNNNIFDIRDDKVVRIVVDGSVRHRDDLIFSELHSGVSISNSNNGRPYLVKDIIVPLKGLTNEDTYTLRARSLVVDKVISDYLTIKIPEPMTPGPSAIEKRYQIYSPFICKIIYDLYYNELVNDLLTTHYDDNTAAIICKPYEYLLKYDPTQAEQSVDSNFVIIHPHNLFTTIELDLFKYRFVERAVKLYSNGLINLSPFLRIKPI